MKPITLRNIPREVERNLRRRAAQKGISLNRAVLEMLEESLGTPCRNKRRVHHDLDFLIGTWSREEAARFDKSLREQRLIDPEMWK